MNRRAVLSRSGALAAIAIAGCLGNGKSPKGGKEPTDTITKVPPGTAPNVDDERLSQLAVSNAAFALDLHQYLAEESTVNQFLSPFSISVALAMTYAGAQGDTEAQMREVLHYTLGEEIHPAIDDLLATLDHRSTIEGSEDDTVDAFNLAVANALWGRQGYSFTDDYLGLLQNYYGGGLKRADFAGDPSDERKRINDWIADKTNDRIQNLLPSNSIGRQTVLVITNAIYFLAGWQFKFDATDTRDANFTALDGSESMVLMMHQHIRTNYASIEGAEAVELPYIGEETSMVLILPDIGEFNTFEQNLETNQLFEIFDGLSDSEGDLALPRFEYKSEVQLSNALSVLGMPDAFSSNADFGGMVADGEGPLIDEIYHQAFVSVDEEGTEAAGATAVVAFQSKPSDWGEIRFDRPFLFCIRDRPTNSVLFIGRVVNIDDVHS